MSTRKLIRQKLVDLISLRTRAEDRVFSSPARSAWQEQLPAILIYSRNEQVQEFSTAPRTLRRQLRITIECLAQLDEALDDELDDLTDEVEAAIGADETLGGIVVDCILEEIEMQLKGEGQTLIGTSSMTYLVTYHTELVDTGEISPLEGIDVDFNLNSDEIIEARDEIDLPQE